MKRLSILSAALLLGTWLSPAQQGLSIQVQLHYTGAGTVDATHKIVVALWDSPDFATSQMQPSAIQSATSKNGVVTFSDVQKVPAYVSAAYDPAGQWDGESGPPPVGSSLGMYTKAPPKPEPITPTPGKTAKVTLSFDDRVKMQ